MTPDELTGVTTSWGATALRPLTNVVRPAGRPELSAHALFCR